MTKVIKPLIAKKAKAANNVASELLKIAANAIDSHITTIINEDFPKKSGQRTKISKCLSNCQKKLD